jgi:iron complex outermembrane receptor protein
VPVAVSVLNSQDIENRRITGASDIQYHAPSLVVSLDPLGGSTAPVFELRGQVPTLGTDDTVVTYFGDVPVNSRAFSGGLFDLASIQVIRGPQGTLFGKNSTGGAVVFTPEKASADAFSGFANATVGNYSLRQVTGGVNIPLIQDKLAVRLSGEIVKRNGFVRNLAGSDGADRNYGVYRASVMATPTEELRNETEFQYFHGRQYQNPLITAAINIPLITFIDGPAIAALVQSQFNHQQQLGVRTIDYSFGKQNDDNDVYIGTNTTTYHLGGVTLKNIAGYVDMSPRVWLSQTSLNWTLVDVLQNKYYNSFSDEMQASGETDTLRWIVGGFYSKEKTKTHQEAYLFAPFLTTKTDSVDRYSSKALFAQGTYDFTKLGLEGVKFTAGLRRTWDSRVGVLNGTTFSPPPPRVAPQVNNRRDYANWSWTLGLDWQVNSDLLLYVASRHSYKAGGLNLVSNVVPPALQTYQPEKLTDLEIGAKTTAHIGDVVVRSNVAAYRGWYKNMQFGELANCGQVASYVVNAAQGTPKGAEFEAEAAITRNFQVGGFYNLTLGKFDKFQLLQPPGCRTIGFGQNLNGADFGNISKHTVGLNASYTVPLQAPNEAIVVSGNFYWRSKRVGSATEGTNSAIPGYSLFDARVDYNNIGGRNISMGAWVHNLGNKTYIAYRNNVLALSGYDNQAYGDPRTYGVDIRYKF